MSDETLKGQESGDEINPTPEYTPGESERMPEPETALDETVNTIVEATEAVEGAPPVQAWDSAVSSTMDAMESVIEEDRSVSHAHSDTVTVPMLGTITVYGGIYTVVFGVLAILTVLEVALAEIFINAGAVKITALLGIGIAKSVLVVMYYMHLKDDNPIFIVILVVPLLITLLSILYLLAVPVAAGLGYS